MNRLWCRSRHIVQLWTRHINYRVDHFQSLKKKSTRKKKLTWIIKWKHFTRIKWTSNGIIVIFIRCNAAIPHTRPLNLTKRPSIPFINPSSSFLVLSWVGNVGPPNRHLSSVRWCWEYSIEFMVIDHFIATPIFLSLVFSTY